jgi:hypothetical protein
LACNSAIASDYGLSSQNLFAARQKFSSAAKRISSRGSDILFVLFVVLVCVRINILIRHHFIDFIGRFGARIIVVTVRISPVVVRLGPGVVDV